MAKRRKKYDDDDGRVIAKMNVDGMPWYTPGPTSSLSEDEKSDEENEGRRENSPNDLSRKEMFWVYIGAMKAGCLVAIIASVIVAVAGFLAAWALGVFGR